MSLKIKYIICILFTLCINTANAQENKVDSLKNILNTKIADTLKIKILLKLADILSYQDPNSAIKFANRAKTISKKLKLNKSLALSYGELGWDYYVLGNYPEALKNSLASLKINQQINNENGIAAAYTLLGSIYNGQDDYQEALRYFFLGLKLAKKTNSKSTVSSCLSNIGGSYYKQALNDENAKNKTENNDTTDRAKNKLLKKTRLLNLSLSYFKQSLQMKKEIGDDAGIATNYGSIGTIYKDFNNFDLALEYHFKALELAKKINYTNCISMNLGHIGAIYTKLNKFKEAESFLLESLAIDKSINSLIGIKYREQDLADLYRTKKDFIKALIHFKEYVSYKDSVFNIEKQEDLTRKEMTFTFDKKNEEIKAKQKKIDAIASHEKQKQKIIIFSICAGLIFVLLLTVFILKANRQKQKINDQIALQKVEIEKQKLQVEEKQKEVLDSIHYAKRIQQALLPTQKFIEKNLNKLNYKDKK